MKANKLNRITNTGLMIALSVVLFFMLRLPFIGFLIAFVLPIPLIITAVQNGTGALMLGLLGTNFLISILFGPATILGYLPFATVSLVLGVGYLYKFKLKNYLITGSIAYTLIALLVLFSGSFLTGVDAVSEFQTFQKTMLETFEKQNLTPAKEKRETLFNEYQELLKEVPVSLDLLDSKKVALEKARQREESLAQLIRQFGNLTQNPLPILLFAGLLYFLIVLKLLNVLGKRLTFLKFPSLELRDWKCPKSFSLVFLLVLFSSPFWNQQNMALGDEISKLTTIVLGIYILMELLFFLFGLSLLLFLTDRWRLSTPLKVLLMSFGILFAQILMLLALFDSFYDIRNYSREVTKKG